MNRIINNGLGEDLRTLILIAGPDIVHHLIEAFDHMEGIDTDLGQRETLFGNRDKAVTHIAAEVFYLLPQLQRKLVEILVHVDVGGRMSMTARESSSKMLQWYVLRYHLCRRELQTPVLPLNSSIQMVSESFLGDLIRMASKTAWTVSGETQLRRAASVNEIGSKRSGRMES